MAASERSDMERVSLVPAPWSNDVVRELSLAERVVAGHALAYSFATDPLSLYLLAGSDTANLSPEQAWKYHVRIMTCTFAAYRVRGVVTAIGPDYDSIALWTPPGRFNDDWWANLRSGLWLLSLRLPVEARKRLVHELAPALHDTREATMGARNKDCYYLGYLGTKPGARGKGYATKLIRNIADRADAENRPIYLESTTLENIPFYTKFGFRIKNDILLERGRIPLYLQCMVREPHAGPAHAAATESSNEGLTCKEAVDASRGQRGCPESRRPA